MAEKQIVCFQSKKMVKICRFFLFLTTIIDILKYLKEMILVYSGGQLL